MKTKQIIPQKSSEKVAVFLEKNALHKRDFAEMIGVTLSYVYNLIDETVSFSTRSTTIERIATVMEIDPEEFSEYKIPQEPILIDETVEAAVKKLDSLPDNEYFSVIEKLAVKRLSDGEGVLSLSSRDLKRVPADFMQKLSAAAQKKGGSVTLGKEPADIENGFVLTYGLIAENCSFRAIIEAEREGVRDTAARELFGQVS